MNNNCIIQFGNDSVLHRTIIHFVTHWTHTAAAIVVFLYLYSCDSTSLSRSGSSLFKVNIIDIKIFFSVFSYITINKKWTDWNNHVESFILHKISPSRKNTDMIFLSKFSSFLFISMYLYYEITKFWCQKSKKETLPKWHIFITLPLECNPSLPMIQYSYNYLGKPDKGSLWQLLVVVFVRVKNDSFSWNPVKYTHESEFRHFEFIHPIIHIYKCIYKSGST